MYYLKRTSRLLNVYVQVPACVCKGKKKTIWAIAKAKEREFIIKIKRCLKDSKATFLGETS